MVQDINALCQLISNPDISGIGVRVAFYVQAILTGILAYAPRADFNASYWTMNITSFALFISAISLHGMGQLSLYQAILVVNLLYVHFFVALACIWPVYNRPKFRKRVTAVVNLADVAVIAVREWWWISLRMVPLTSITTIFGLIVWIHPLTFGSQPNCNPHTTFAFLGIPLSATGSGRVVGLVFVGLQGYTTAVVLVTDVALLVLSVFFSKPSRKPAFLTAPAPETLLNGTLNEREAQLSASDLFYKHLKISQDGSKNRMGPFLEEWAVPMAGIFLVSVFLVTIERTIAENAWLSSADNSDSAWTLGQIFPLVMIGVPVTSLIKISSRYCQSRRRRARRLAEMNKDPVVGLRVGDWHAHLSLKI